MSHEFADVLCRNSVYFRNDVAELVVMAVKEGVMAEVVSHSFLKSSALIGEMILKGT